MKKILEGMLRTRLPALFPEVNPQLVEDALNYSAVYGVEPWDGYLVAAARMLGIEEIHSIDEQLSKVKKASVRNQFPKEKM